jgi:hypothetical protein
MNNKDVEPENIDPSIWHNTDVKAEKNQAQPIIADTTVDMTDEAIKQQKHPLLQKPNPPGRLIKKIK